MDLHSLIFFLQTVPLWDNVENVLLSWQAIDANMIRRMHIACWIPKSTDTRSSFLKLTAFPQQQLFNERCSVLRYNYAASLV
jgi:hypothetical protein